MPMARHQVLRAVADSRDVCYAPSVRRSTLSSTLRGSEGLGLVEVMAVTVIVGIAVIGVALMFGKGSAWVSATGADRVAAGLAQQRIEQIRACGWDAATKSPPEANCSAPASEPAPLTGLGAVLEETGILAANNNTFTRRTCIQYDDPAAPLAIDDNAKKEPAEPVFDPPPPSCLPGNASSVIRITVIVSANQLEASPVTLRAWMSQDQ